MAWIGSLLISAISLLVGAYFIKGVKLRGFVDALLVAVVIAVLNGILSYFLAPLNWITLGLFQFVIDAIVIFIVSRFMSDRFRVDSLFTALILAVIVAVSSSIIHWLL